ncbi:MAG: hypothetical protein JO060_02205 [Candidatus Eremiobacteraeota bacterium]|nr:hypothetical protein [Candidatus Eremiobacteraeota bacterium]
MFFCAVVLATATLAKAAPVGPSPTPAQTATPSPQNLIVKGRLLTVSGGYLVFTTGDAVRLGDITIPSNIGLGSTVRVRIDPATHLVTAIEPQRGAAPPGEIDASALPRDVVVVDPQSARAAASTTAGPAQVAAGTVTVTIDVTVPDVTPPGDDVYLSTARTNFASAELRMSRVDAFNWTISLPLPAGSTLRYEFTRGSPATVERRKNGSVLTPRELTSTPSLHQHDRVERWSDRF